MNEMYVNGQYSTNTEEHHRSSLLQIPIQITQLSRGLPLLSLDRISAARDAFSERGFNVYNFHSLVRRLCMTAAEKHNNRSTSTAMNE